MQTKNLYQVLSLESRDVSFEELKKAYRAKALQLHPDVCPSSVRDECTKKFVELHKAYEVLSDPNTRRMYDNELMLVESFGSCDSSCDQREKFSRKVWEVQLDGLKKRSADRMAKGEETVVGFDDEVQTLLDQVSYCNLYNAVADYFYCRNGWACVDLCFSNISQEGSVSRAWTCILTSCINNVNDETYNMSDEQLGQKLYWLLKGRRYLVVFDDIWDCKTWNDLRVYFPDDNVGSRVLLTSRDIELSLHVQGAKPTHVLRLRTEDESLAIISKKVFRTGVCAPWLEGDGKVITRKCEGLPLAIVITAGILKNNWSYTWWLQISASLHSVLVHDSSQYMDSLALSYNHLPPHLRQCFVFVGIFPEDYDIPVTKLVWLWIAQGFIHETESRILEDVAEDFLMGLIKRSLLMTAKKRADGRIKTCRIHEAWHLWRFSIKPRLLNTMMFLEKLKKLTLSNTCMDWEDMWVISLLSNLEILKLKFHACIGETWDTSDAEFKQLKILKRTTRFELKAMGMFEGKLS
ncbi:hypothetical protein QVD17_32069 [Tagetes erecta]|uniref:J domain-containing protein n=1 Tax=Tagetes erecta TaxID=13708 RepID=A0AAD8K4Y1_TARER|nr:hypothetical protein QVD17_32061 [Tagetes erecta]KAK1416280.1 hypothetical protein QVD17_32069 [Tagetes erecta]